MIGELALLKAIRSGDLAEVKAILDAGTPPEFDDGQGEPDLPMGVACYMGFPAIVRELFARGARVNRPDNSAPTSPLSMAKRGGKVEVVRTLIELGADLPEGFETGLSDYEVMLAQLIAIRDGHATPRDSALAAQAQYFEEVDAVGCSGTDTNVLEADILRAARTRS